MIFLAYFAHQKLEIVLSAPVPAYLSGRRGRQKGGVDIRVECVTPDGLSGKKRDLVSWYFSFDWHSWGESVCE